MDSLAHLDPHHAAYSPVQSWLMDYLAKAKGTHLRVISYKKIYASGKLGKKEALDDRISSATSGIPNSNSSSVNDMNLSAARAAQAILESMLDLPGSMTANYTTIANGGSKHAKTEVLNTPSPVPVGKSTSDCTALLKAVSGSSGSTEIATDKETSSPSGPSAGFSVGTGGQQHAARLVTPARKDSTSTRVPASSPEMLDVNPEQSAAVSPVITQNKFVGMETSVVTNGVSASLNNSSTSAAVDVGVTNTLNAPTVRARSASPEIPEPPRFKRPPETAVEPNKRVKFNSIDIHSAGSPPAPDRPAAKSVSKKRAQTACGGRRPMASPPSPPSQAKDLAETVARLKAKQPIVDPRLCKPTPKPRLPPTKPAAGERFLIPPTRPTNEARPVHETLTRIAHAPPPAVSSVPAQPKKPSTSTPLPEIPVLPPDLRPDIQLTQPLGHWDDLTDATTLPCLPPLPKSVSSPMASVMSYRHFAPTIIPPTASPVDNVFHSPDINPPSSSSRTTSIKSIDHRPVFFREENELPRQAVPPTLADNLPQLSTTDLLSPPSSTRSTVPSATVRPQAKVHPSRPNEMPRTETVGSSSAKSVRGSERQGAAAKGNNRVTLPGTSKTDMDFYVDFLIPLLKEDCEKLMLENIKAPEAESWAVVFDNHKMYRDVVVPALYAQIRFMMVQNFKTASRNTAWNDNPQGLTVSEEKCFKENGLLVQFTVSGDSEFLARFHERELLAMLYSKLGATDESMAVALVYVIKVDRYEPEAGRKSGKIMNLTCIHFRTVGLAFHLLTVGCTLQLFIANEKVAPIAGFGRSAKFVPCLDPNKNIALYRVVSLEYYHRLAKPLYRLGTAGKSIGDIFLPMLEDSFRLTVTSDFALIPSPVSGPSSFNTSVLRSMELCLKSLKYGSEEQRQIVGALIESMCHTTRPKLALIDGPPGSGKTCVLAMFLRLCVMDNNETTRVRILVTAPTAKATQALVRKIVQTWMKQDSRKLPKLLWFDSPNDVVPTDLKGYSLQEKLKETRGASGSSASASSSSIRRLEDKILDLQKKLSAAQTSNHAELQRKIDTFQRDLQKHRVQTTAAITSLSAKSKAGFYCPTADELKCCRKFDAEIFVAPVSLASCSTEFQILLDTFAYLVIYQAGQLSELATLGPVAAHRVNPIQKTVLFGHKFEIPTDEDGVELVDCPSSRSFFQRAVDYHETTEGMVARLTLQQHLIPDVSYIQPAMGYYQNQKFVPMSAAACRSWPFEDYMIFGLLKRNRADQMEMNWEVERVARLLKVMLLECSPEKNYVVLTRSIDHRAAMTAMLDQKKLIGIEVCTAAEFQGRDACIVIYCAFNPPDTDTELEKKRLYVALTGATRTLVIVGYSSTLQSQRPWKDWYLEAQRRGKFGEISAESPDDQIRAYLVRSTLTAGNLTRAVQPRQ